MQLNAIEGHTSDLGAIADVTTTSHPVSVALHVLQELPECFFVGQGADAVAEESGLTDVVSPHGELHTTVRARS